MSTSTRELWFELHDIPVIGNVISRSLGLESMVALCCKRLTREEFDSMPMGVWVHSLAFSISQRDRTPGTQGDGWVTLSISLSGKPAIA